AGAPDPRTRSTHPIDTLGRPRPTTPNDPPWQQGGADMIGGRRQWRSRVVAAAFGSTVLVGTLGIAAPPSSAVLDTDEPGAPAATTDDVTIEPFEEREQAVTGGDRFLVYDPSTG